MIVDSRIVNIDEAYFGPGALKPLQDQLTVVRRKFKNKPFSTSWAIDKEILKFNRIAEKIFGYSSFSFSISADSSANAWALHMTSFNTEEERKKLLNALRAGKAGFRFDASGEVIGMVSFNLGLLNIDDFKDEELLAIMLHEIGHNFFESVMYGDSAYGLSKKLTSALRLINKRILRAISSGKEVNEDMIEKDVDNLIPEGFLSFSKMKQAFLEPISIFAKVAKEKFKKVAGLFQHEAMSDNLSSRSMEAYTNEKFADTFAAMYGYGAYLHSALLKFDDYYASMRTRKQSTNPVIVAYKVFKLNLRDALWYMMDVKDEHPDGLTRIKVSTDYLKKEIAKEGIDPKVKTQLIEQLDTLNRLIEEYINYPTDQDKIKIARTYYTMLYKKFGGDRRERDADNTALFDFIDKRYEELTK